MIFKLIVIILFLIGISSLTAQSQEDKLSSKVSYFIDADCGFCSLKSNKNNKIYVVTNATYRGDLEDQSELLNKFSEQLIKQLAADSTLIKRAVFRFQKSKNEILHAYDLKVNKMKSKGYKVIKIDFNP
jgi:hypothetical protein